MELQIETRNYTKYTWKVANGGHEDNSIKCPNPMEQKLFHGSVFDFDTGILLPSPILKNKKIPGVLILEGNKTYGRQIKGSSSSSAKGRLYYRCIPNSKHLPVFLIPYEPTMDFSKHQVNLFVLFEYKEWTASHAPYGILTETIGKVSDLSAYYEYLLHCRGMHFSHQTAINQKIRQTKMETKMKNGFHFDSNPKLKPNTKPNPGIFIFSIDPQGSKDLDDAFSIHSTQHEKDDCVYVIRIYISDMVYWASHFNLWEDLRLEKTGANTLYLPERNRVMVPSILSDQKASLLADGDLKPVMVYELEISLHSGKVIGCRFYRDQVFIHANYRYDTEELEKCEHYRHMFEVTRKWTSRHEDNIQDSHELVAHWMVEYNRAVGKELSEIGRGIYRVYVQKLPETVADATEKGELEWKRIMRYWKSDVKGQYAFYSSEIETMVHYGMVGGYEVYYYAHASSPIRRLVDIYNQSCLVNKMDSGVGVGVGAVEGMRIFQTEMEKPDALVELNRQTSESKRVQMECEMLAAFFSCPDIETVEYEGTVMDIDISRGAWVYLSFWKRVVFVGVGEGVGGYEDISIGDRKKCQIFLFEEEEKAIRKVAVRFVG